MLKLKFWILFHLICASKENALKASNSGISVEVTYGISVEVRRKRLYLNKTSHDGLVLRCN